MEIFRLFGSVFVDTDKAEKSLSQVDKQAQGTTNVFSKIVKGLGKWAAMIGVSLSIAVIKKFGSACIDAWEAQETAETKLETIMKQRMKSTDEGVQSVKTLTAELQKQGVVGDEVQLAGAQQVSTFLNQEKSLKTLLPAMNNLLVQQKGVKATQQDAVNIGNMFGKVMQGQTSALKRTGVTFTEAQEKVLKYGTETEKAAMLAQVVKDNVGDMNAAMLKTDTGKIQKAKNSFGDLQELIGSKLQPILANLYEKFGEISDWIINNFDPAIQAITPYIDDIGIALGIAASGFIAFKTAGAVSNMISMFNGISAAIGGITVANVGMTASEAAKSGAMTISSMLVGLLTGQVTIGAVATGLYTKAQGALNAVMNANPIGIVVLAITGLVAAIVLAYKNSEGFRNIVNTLWNGVKSAFAGIANAVSIGLSKVKTFINNAVVTFNTFKAKISTFMTNVKTIFKIGFNAVKNFITKPINTAKTMVMNIFNAIKTGISSKISSIKSTVSSKFESIKSAIMTPIEKAKDKVKEYIDKIKSFFTGFSAHIKLPHFSIKNASLNPKNWIKNGVPKLSVDWYKGGGILTKPTIFGMNGSSFMAGGEAGKEAVAPLSDLKSYLFSAIDYSNSGNNELLYQILKEIQETNTLTSKLIKLLNNAKMVLNDREFARLVNKYAG